MTMGLFLVLMLALVQESLGFAVSNHARTTTALYNAGADDLSSKDPGRRSVLMVGALLTTILPPPFVSAPAFADVSDGNMLPQGAAQFQRLLKVKSDLAVISKRVADNAADIDKKEWDNIGQFLRRLYAAGDDMKGVAGGIYDPSKKKQAEEDIKLLQKYAKAGEGPVNKQDGEAFLAVMKKSDELIGDFFDQLRDIPDEI